MPEKTIQSEANPERVEALATTPCSPNIRVFLGDSTRKPDCEAIYFGSHSRIPTIGEHVCVQYRAHEVWRVEHILSNETGCPAAHVYLAAKGS